MIGVDENDNKPESEDASHDEVDDFNQDTCVVCLYDVEIVVYSTENNVEVQELFEDDRNYVTKLNLKMLLRTRLMFLMRIHVGYLVRAKCMSCPWLLA